MSLNVGGSPVSNVYLGDSQVSGIYLGSQEIWTSRYWDFEDDFERSSIGSAWQGSGAVIAGTAPNRHLKKNNTAGSADYWSVQQFGGDDFVIEALIGPVLDSQQAGSISWGTTNEYIFIEFSKTKSNIIGDYNGRAWNTRASLPQQQWAEGDVIRVERTGTTVSVFRNGSLLASATSTLARGVGKRRLALSVRMDKNFLLSWYGPTFDEVRVRAR